MLITGVMISGWQVGGVCLYSANCMSPNQYDPSFDTAYAKGISNEWYSCLLLSLLRECFLAVQDSSIGDIVSQSVSESVSQ